MNNGAHFFNCDFQVHSPRDRGWHGPKFGVNTEDITILTDESREEIRVQRLQFAREYLDKIRNAGLNAIAVTDHHDVTFAKIIREVATEDNEKFYNLGQIEKIITVFPGIELSLSNPASQAIIIFDANIENNHLDSILNFLGINPSDEFDRSTIETNRISQEIVKDLTHLHKKLDELAYCKNRYIILPHIGDGGQHSILRQGFHEHYRKMPCVGGYVDKAISSSPGYQNKLNGGDVHYGNKSVAVISTSDNRFEDGREFGKYSSWIKWAEPTAEAIRQACLAKESRISQIKPQLPQIFIKSIDVTNSKFIGSFDLNLNAQYNALIGGRGTGKSTILEYIRWGLCDQLVQNSSLDDLTSIEKRRNALIQNTLIELGGEVRITMEKNGISHIVKRNSSSKEVQLKIGNGDFQVVKEEDIRKLLPIQSYSQKQLSDVGVKTEELKRFIEQPIIDELNTLRFKLKDVSIKLKQSYSQLIRKKTIEQEITQLNLESTSLTRQIENIRTGITGSSGISQEIIDQKNLIESEEKVISAIDNEVSILRTRSKELQRLVEQYSDNVEKSENFHNKELVENITNAFKIKFNQFRELTALLNKVFDGVEDNELQQHIENWRSEKEAFEAIYNTAKRKSNSSEQLLKEIESIENKIKAINSSISEKTLALREIGVPDDEFASQWESWKTLHEEKIRTLNDQAKMFTSLSNNLIKAEVAKSINLQPVKALIKSLFEGTRIREEKIDALVDYIQSSEEPLETYVAILSEFRLIAEYKISDGIEINLPETPYLILCGFNDEHKAKLCSKLTTDDWIRLSTWDLEFNPEFYYQINNEFGDVIPFREASAGQQATALLTVLLNQSGIPLIIDQPEDDIDNKAIDQIIQDIWKAKTVRQLIFTSHNANLVVNGDAELVICCDYRDSSSQTRGTIKAKGAIDKIDVRNEITSIMEGGEKAFKLRKAKYGF